MKNILIPFTALATLFLTPSCASRKAMDNNAPTGAPSATFKFKGGTAAYWASAQAGEGTIYYNGKAYPFEASALGAGGTGLQQVATEGEIYNLNSIQDVSGTYTQVTSGFTLIKGKRHTKLTNQKGVVVYAVAKTTGVASSTGATKVNITLK